MNGRIVIQTALYKWYEEVDWVNHFGKIRNEQYTIRTMQKMSLSNFIIILIILYIINYIIIHKDHTFMDFIKLIVRFRTSFNKTLATIGIHNRWVFIQEHTQPWKGIVLNGFWNGLFSNVIIMLLFFMLLRKCQVD